MILSDLHAKNITMVVSNLVNTGQTSIGHHLSLALEMGLSQNKPKPCGCGTTLNKPRTGSECNAYF